MDLAKTAELNVNKCIDDVFTKQNIKSYLHVLGKFPLYDYRNQLLIWKQCPDATAVVGKMGYESEGNVIPDGTKKILLLSPQISLVKEGVPVLDSNGSVMVDEITKSVAYEILPEYASEYEAVVAYDVSDLVECSPRSKEGLVNRIKFCSGYSVEEVGEADLPEDAKYGEIDIENNVFKIKRDITEDMFCAELLCQYVEEERRSYPADEFELCLRALSKIAICDAFGVSYREQSTIRINTAKRESFSFRRELLEQMSMFTSEVITDLSTPQLSFNEVVIANSLLHEPSFPEMEIDFFTVRENLKDEYLKAQILTFSEKLFQSKEGYLEKLCEKVKNRSLYAYPPYEFEYNL